MKKVQPETPGAVFMDWMASLTLPEWAAVGTLILAIAAVAGIWLTFGQIRQRTLQAKASFLFDLDQMWESPAFTVARAAFFELLRTIENQVDHNKQYKNAEERLAEICEEMSKMLFYMRNNEIKRYLRILKLCGFFETAGLLVKQGYVSKGDILNLYGGSIERVHDAVASHLQKRREEPGMPPGYFENFEYLAEKAASLHKSD